MGPHLSPDPLSVPWTELCLRSSAGVPAAPHLYHHVKGTQPVRGPCSCHLLCFRPHHYHPLCPIISIAAATQGSSESTHRWETPRTFLRVRAGDTRHVHTVTAPLSLHVSFRRGRLQPQSASLACRAPSSHAFQDSGGCARCSQVLRPKASSCFSSPDSSAWFPPPLSPSLLVSGLSPLISPSPRSGGHWSPKVGPGETKRVRTETEGRVWEMRPPDLNPVRFSGGAVLLWGLGPTEAVSHGPLSPHPL